jgi:hypothetical protein
MIDWIRPSRQWLLSSALSGPDVRGLARIAPGLSNGRPDSGLALCSTHYERIWQWRRAGKPQLASLDARMGRLCSTDNDAAWLSARTGRDVAGRATMPMSRPIGECACAWASTSATQSQTARTCTAMASMPPPGWRPYARWVAFAFHAQCETMCTVVSTCHSSHSGR